jgi:transmembrane sensor
MSTIRPSAPLASRLEVKAQAAAWLAALRGPHRTPDLTDRFNRWLSEDEDHRAVWEQMNAGWDLTGALQVDMTRVAAAAEREARDTRVTRAVAASVLIAVLVAGSAFYFLHHGSVSTAIGEQRVMTLEDGTRVVLNTNTSVQVRYGKTARRVSLQSGEAVFEVGKDSRRPFVVTAGDREITALGTAFLVRRDEEQLAVTLLEGKVAISNVALPAAEQGAAPPPAEPADGTLTLAAGERLTLARHRAAKLDRPELKRVTAWRSGEVAFDETPLPEAIAEMNRYSTTTIKAQGPLPEERRVSGLFRAGDSLDFARGIAETYGLELTERDRQIILSPHQPAQP